MRCLVIEQRDGCSDPPLVSSAAPCDWRGVDDKSVATQSERLNGKRSKDRIVANRVFTALANQTIDTFVAGFIALSKKVFYDQENNKLRHPGEFGTFRERICAQFLQPFIPPFLDVGSGFLINCKDGVSTQCDLVIYDSQYTPTITDAQNLRFFPIETVVCIGEVKSKLTKQDFFSALIKLAENKNLSNAINGSVVRRCPRISSVESSHHYDMTASILICEKFDFSLEHITARISDHYDRHNISLECRHNMVLSINDGILCYSNHLIERNIAWMYPSTNNERMKNRFVSPGDSGRNHFDIFTAYMFMICANTTVYLPSIGSYLARPSVGHYQDEK